MFIVGFMQFIELQFLTLMSGLYGYWSKKQKKEHRHISRNEQWVQCKCTECLQKGTWEIMLKQVISQSRSVFFQMQPVVKRY